MPYFSDLQEEEMEALKALWDFVKGRLDDYALEEIAGRFPQFRKEARQLAQKVRDNKTFESNARDHFLEMNDTR